MRSRQGFAVAVVLLVTVVALMAAVGATTLTSLTARQTATSERRATTALFAAESGLNTLAVRSDTAAYEFRGTDASVQQWLDRVNLDSYGLPNGAVVNLSAVNEGDGFVTIRSEGIAPGGSRRVVLQEFELVTAVGELGLFANAALVTQGSLDSNSAKSKIIGRDSKLGSWIFTERRLNESLAGEYFKVELTCDGVTGPVLFEVLEGERPTDDGLIDVEDVAGTCTTTELADGTAGTLIPFAVAGAKDSMGFDVGKVYTQSFEVTDTTIYAEGNTLYIGDAKATIDTIEGNIVTVTWNPSLPTAGTIGEGTPIRLEVPSAIAGTTCPSGPKTLEKLPQGCYTQDLSNIWDKTFPDTSKGEMLDMAVDNASHFGPDTEDEEWEDWPTGHVSGVTWIDGAQSGNFNGKGGGDESDGETKGLCGEGIVILNTGVFDAGSESKSINLNVSDCEFNGVLYVIGELGIEGNLESFSGTVIVETDQGTRVQGNGDKSIYDPIAIRRALANLPPPTTTTGIMGGLTSTWRFGK